MKASYPKVIEFVLKQEGGYTNHPKDPGGPTNFGITIHDARLYWKADATAADVKAMPLAVAKDIYKTKYWNKMSGDDIRAGLDLFTMDSGVNSGVGRAYKWLSKALGVPENKSYPYLAKLSQNASVDVPKAIKTAWATRLSFLKSLRTWATFGKGWGRRVAEGQALSLVIFHQAEGKSPAQVQKLLSDEVKTSEKAKANDQTTTAVTAAGSGGGAWQWWEWDFLHVSIAAVAISIVLYFGAKVIQSRNQIAAYNAEIAALDAQV